MAIKRLKKAVAIDPSAQYILRACRWNGNGVDKDSAFPEVDPFLYMEELSIIEKERQEISNPEMVRRKS